MVDHWDRPGWTNTTRAYYWLLTVTSQQLRDQARYCQEQVRHLGLDEIAQDGLHLTMGRVGLREEIELPTLRDLATAASHDAPPAADIHAIPLTASPGAIRYSIAPWTPLTELYTHLSSAALQVGLPSRDDPDRFRPHIGIAYSNKHRPADEVREAIEPLRALPVVPVRVEHVHLVELRREPGAYRWNAIHAVPLRAQ
ncbi:2'-5' RNA ligase family protein [Streptomyces noursei]|nr:2'-5' RNA ligase family protein [Streptomyces noursei]